MERWDWLALAGLAVLLFASRLAWLVWNPDSALYWEEDYRWVAAREILAGPVQPLGEYQADSYQGGSLVVIGVVVASFALLGESLLSFKLVPLLFAGATLAALYALGRVAFDRRVALLACVGYVAGPPLVAHSALVPMGSHGESALFALVQMLCFAKLRSGQWQTLRGWAALGLVSGLGLWFCYTAGLALAACGLAWLVLEGVPRPRQLLAAVAGLVAGLSPWIAYNLRHGFAGFQRLVEVFGGGDAIDAWAPQGPLEKLVSLLVRDLPAGMVDPFGDLGAVGAALGVALYAPVVAALAVGAVRVVRFLAAGSRVEVPDAGPRGSELLLHAYGLLFVVAYLGSSFAIDPEHDAHAYRLLLPWIVVSWLPAAVTAARALDGSAATRHAAAAGIALVLGASAVGTIAIAAREPEQSIGADVTEHVKLGTLTRGVLLHRRFEGDLARAFEAARRVPDLRERFRIFQGVGWGIQYRFEGDGRLQPFLAEVDRLPLGERVAVLSGLRWGTNDRVSQLRAVVAKGEATPRQRERLERLEGLAGPLERRWSRVPFAYQHADRILYRNPPGRAE